MSIGIGNNSDIRMRTAHDQAMLAQFNPVENFEYTQNSQIAILGSGADVRTPRDLEMLRMYSGCSANVTEGYRRNIREGYMGPKALDGSPCGCSCKAGCACGFSRTSSNPFNPWADFATYSPMQ